VSTVYLSTTKLAHFAQARQDLVTLLTDFQEQMEVANVRPNITTVVDNHIQRGSPTPYISVGVTNVGEMDYVSRSGSIYEIRLPIEMQIWLHVSPLEGQYDERMKWNLLNSLFNYLKDVSTISTSFDAMFLRRITGDMAFDVSGTAGAIVDLTVYKVATT